MAYPEKKRPAQNAGPSAGGGQHCNASTLPPAAAGERSGAGDRAMTPPMNRYRFPSPAGPQHAQIGRVAIRSLAVPAEEPQRVVPCVAMMEQQPFRVDAGQPSRSAVASRLGKTGAGAGSGLLAEVAGGHATWSWYAGAVGSGGGNISGRRS